MSIAPENERPVEFGSEELKQRGPGGERIVQLGLTVWNTAQAKSFEVASDRWEGGKIYPLSWTELMELHAQMTSTIEFLKPLVDAGTVIVK
jgi:hypothetical protein